MNVPQKAASDSTNREKEREGQVLELHDAEKDNKLHNSLLE